MKSERGCLTMQQLHDLLQRFYQDSGELSLKSAVLYTSRWPDADSLLLFDIQVSRVYKNGLGGVWHRIFFRKEYCAVAFTDLQYITIKGYPSEWPAEFLQALIVAGADFSGND